MAKVCTYKGFPVGGRGCMAKVCTYKDFPVGGEGLHG